MTTATRAFSDATENTAPTSKFRLDIEGLRAIAVVFVVVWHAGVAQLPGGFVGVDVFFVISGFLMTGILYRELEKSGRITFLNFFARRVKRLIPASALTIAVTLLAAWVILPSSRVIEIAYDSIAAMLYVVNWRMADGSVDYFAQDLSASPLQHFWSLSVEEQFYIFWPLMLGAIAILVRSRLCTARSGVLWALVTVFVTSLGWSIYYTAASPSQAYFVTTTRLWELALGGLVAIALAKRSSFPRVGSAVVSWLGLAAVFFAGFFFETSMPFPGVIALVPTLGTAALITFTPSAGTAGPLAILSMRPMTWLGSISYSLYLWHWPVIVLGAALITRSTRSMSVTEGLILALVSILPAWLSLKFVEDPIRRSRWTNEARIHTLFIGLVATALPLALAMSMAINLRTTQAIAAAQGELRYSATSFTSASGVFEEVVQATGAQLLMPDPSTSPDGETRDSVDSIYPPPATAATSHPTHHQDGCHVGIEASEFRYCEYGDLTSDYSILLAGDSHAANWGDAFAEVARTNGWKLVVGTKSSCPLNTASFTLASVGDYEACTMWNDEAMTYLTGSERPDVLVLTHSAYGPTVRGGSDAFIAGAVEVIERAQEAGVQVVTVRDTPAAPTNVAECVDANQSRLTVCAFDRGEALARADQLQPRVVEATGVDQIDMTEWICPREQCPPVIGGVLVWRDAHHLTHAYSRTLGRPLISELARVGVS